MNIAKEEDIKKFQDSGLLWFINGTLHTFGWSITIEKQGDKIVDFYPRRVSFRGYSDEANTEGYIKVSNYMKNNSKELLEESMIGIKN